MVEGSKVADNERLLPKDITTTATKESMAEIKPIKQIFKTGTLLHDEFDELLNKNDNWKTLRFCGWISRFIQDSRKQGQKKSGQLTTKKK